MRLTFKQFLKESKDASSLITQMATTLTPDEVIIKKHLIKMLNPNNSKFSEFKLVDRGSNNRANKEVLRASNIGKTKEEIENNVRRIFEILKSSGLNVKILNFEKFGVNLPGGSGKYNSIEINVELEIKGNKYEGIVIATSTSNDSGKLRNKDLVPTKFIKAGKDYTKESLINDVEQALKTIGIDQTIKQYLSDIIESFKHVSNSASFKEYVHQSHLDDLHHHFKSDLYGEISPADINNILKDFGEIIQPLIFASQFSNINITYPSVSNSSLTDFNLINDGELYEFSAKAGNKGGIPSGKIYFDNIDLESSNLTSDEIEFVEMMKNSYKNDIRSQQCSLVYDLLLEDGFFKNNKIKSFYEACLNGFKPGDKINYKSFIDNANKWFSDNNLLNDKNKFSDFWNDLYNEFNYFPKEYKSEIMYDKWTNMAPETKYGVIMYAPYKTSVNILNSKYSDILTNIIRKTQNIFQSYLTLNNGNEFIIKIKRGKAQRYKFATGGMSTNNITNAKLGIEMK